MSLWPTLAARPDLISAAASGDPADARHIEKLRRTFGDPDLVRAALALTEARRKARKKLGPGADTLWADPQGVEMASSPLAASYKARRIANLAPGADIADLCCGIGGDAMRLVETHESVLAIDADPARCWMTEQNTRGRARAIAADAASIDVTNAFVHIDPARRTATSRGTKRAWRLEDLAPNPATLRAILNKTTIGAAVKLGPGVDHAQARTLLPPGELEFISENGQLTQAVLWVPRRSPADMVPDNTNLNSTRATLLRAHPHERSADNTTFTLSGTPDERQAPIAPGHAPRHYLLEPDDSIERACLQHVLCENLNAELLHPALGLLTADQLPVPDSPWVTPFCVLAHAPWNFKRVRERLADLGAGPIEVKTRGVSSAQKRVPVVIDPDRLQLDLHRPDGRPITIFILRFGHEIRAIIAERLWASPAGA